MPILIMGLIALLVFVTIVALVCSAGMAERHEHEEAEAHGPTPMAPPPGEVPAHKTKTAA
jgi:hypothetical protein